MRRLWRVFVFFSAFLCVVMPAWNAVRNLAAASSIGSRPTQAAQGPTLDEEETPEVPEPHRSNIGPRRDASRREGSIAAAGELLRHRVEWDSARAARRWASYRAPPRAPPHRLLN